LVELEKKEGGRGGDKKSAGMTIRGSEALGQLWVGPG